MWSPIIVVFTSLIGLGAVWPLLPFQAMALGATPQLVTLLLVIDTIFILLAAPLLGRLSDRIGRKPVIVIGLAHAPVAYVLMAEADTLLLLFASRALAGVSNAVVSTVQAYVADHTPPARRVVGMAGIIACFGLAFALGPLIAIPTLGPGGDDYAATAWAACGFATFSVLLATVLIRGDGPRAAAMRSARASTSGLAALKPILEPRCSVPIGVMIIMAFVYETMVATLGLWSAETIAWGAKDLSIAFGICGFAAVIPFLGVAARLSGWFGERAVAGGAAVGIVVGLLILAFVPTTLSVRFAMGLMGGGIALCLSCLQAVISQAAPSHLQGSVMGVSHSLASLARILGPQWGGYSLAYIGLSWPYISGAILIFGALLLLSRAPQRAPSLARKPVEG